MAVSTKENLDKIRRFVYCSKFQTVCQDSAPMSVAQHVLKWNRCMPTAGLMTISKQV